MMAKKTTTQPQRDLRPIKNIILNWSFIFLLILAWLLIRIGNLVTIIGHFILWLIFNLAAFLKKILLGLGCILKRQLVKFWPPNWQLIKFRFHLYKKRVSLPWEKFIHQSTTRVKQASRSVYLFLRRPFMPALPAKEIVFLEKRKTRSPWLYFLGGIIFSVFFLFIPYQFLTYLNSLPNPRLLSIREIPVTSKIFDRKGILLYEIYATENRTPVSLDNIPQYLKDATIAIEDKEFYSHPGFSPRAILRAAEETILKGRPQGGSTITQQLIRSAFLTPQPTIARKMTEILLSFWAERLYSKEQILEMYFNQVPYGGTAWGAEAAAETYFGKKISELTLAEAAMLAAIPASPSVYSPFGTHPEQGLARQKEVLTKMREQGYITTQQEENAKGETLKLQSPQTNIRAPHFVMYVKEILEKEYGPRMVQMGGLRVTTSLDLAVQEMAQQIVSLEVDKLKDLHVGNGASLITDPQTGEILAMVGSKNYFDIENQGNVNVSLSLQQPGSSIKVVNYALALHKGFTAATVLDDSPITFQIPGQPPYSPVNYDSKFHGQIALRYALANSYNVPAVKVLSKLGVKEMIDQGRKMGIGSWQDESRYGLSLTLGGGEVTMLDMARVYGTLANQGKLHELKPILQISDYKGKVLKGASVAEGEQVIPEEVAFILSNILADNQARSTAFGPNSLLVIPGKTVSVKTGTSNDLRDNWAIGYTPSYVVTTWVGNNDNSPMSYIASGITGATPIWHNIMANLLKDKQDEPILPPENIIQAEACGRREYFISGTEKNVSCPAPSPTPSPAPMLKKRNGRPVGI